MLLSFSSANQRISTHTFVPLPPSHDPYSSRLTSPFRPLDHLHSPLSAYRDASSRRANHQKSHRRELLEVGAPPPGVGCRSLVKTYRKPCSGVGNAGDGAQGRRRRCVGTTAAQGCRPSPYTESKPAFLRLEFLILFLFATPAFAPSRLLRPPHRSVQRSAEPKIVDGHQLFARLSQGTDVAKMLIFLTSPLFGKTRASCAQRCAFAKGRSTREVKQQVLNTILFYLSSCPHLATPQRYPHPRDC